MQRTQINTISTFLFLFLCSLAVTACGFTPLYGEDKATASKLSQVDIEPQHRHNGQKLNLLLEDHFYSLKPEAPQPAWRLRLSTDVSSEKLGISSEEDTATRIRITAQTEMSLYKAGETTPRYSGTQRAYASYNILTDPYATRAAREDAIDRSLSELAQRITMATATHLASEKDHSLKVPSH